MCTRTHADKHSTGRGTNGLLFGGVENRPESPWKIVIVVAERFPRQIDMKERRRKRTRENLNISVRNPRDGGFTPRYRNIYSTRSAHVNDGQSVE